MCNLGQCECFDGYTGADCSQRGGGSGSSIPGWAVALIVLSSCAVAGMLMAALGAIIQAVAARFSGEAGMGSWGGWECWRGALFICAALYRALLGEGMGAGAHPKPFESSPLCCALALWRS